MRQQALAKLREQLEWRGPNGKPQGILTLTREEAQALVGVDLLRGLSGYVRMSDGRLYYCERTTLDQDRKGGHVLHVRGVGYIGTFNRDGSNWFGPQDRGSLNSTLIDADQMRLLMNT